MLVQKGHELIARKWRCQVGELDLVTRDRGCLVFVEVRTRRGDALGSPEESVTVAKRARLAALAESYVQVSDWQGDWRIDFVAVELDRGGRLARIEHYEDAVTG